MPSILSVRSFKKRSARTLFVTRTFYINGSVSGLELVLRAVIGGEPLQSLSSIVGAAVGPSRGSAPPVNHIGKPSAAANCVQVQALRVHGEIVISVGHVKERDACFAGFHRELDVLRLVV
ncbi:hypothetical protein NDU88_006763 [Pleurodeles waltl]|uniref:Uncharacterized protein n=1 Tax=Pleurodeles waltl TaxID=8319 RepID=A0AAV7X1L3_PLEWA|nr:hypothetical protein NDU88_006763 [Pleurodeles waltl]